MQQNQNLFLFIGILMMIYVGSCCYVIAAYYHLKYNKNWRFITAISIALPIVIIEYIFSLHGNHYANIYLGLTAIDILIITICFYFINLWMLNYFVLRHKPKSILNEVLAFACILGAFTITTVLK